MALPRLDPTINLGDLLKMLTIVLSLTGTVWWVSATFATIEQRLSVGEAVRAARVPLLESLATSVSVLNSQLVVLNAALQEIHQTNRAIVADVTSIRERLSSIESRIRNNAGAK